MANAEQNEPILDGSTEASLDSKKQGVLVQVASDTAGRRREDVVAMLGQRLRDAGITADAAELERLADALPTVNDQDQAENREARDAH